MEDTYKKILVAVDGSEQSIKALRVADGIAERNNAELIVMNAYEPSVAAMTTPTDEQAYEHLKDFAKKNINDPLADAVKEISEDVNYVAITETGNPKAEIVRYAENNGVDLIVIGATGKGAFSRLLVGSTTNFVINHAPCTVTVVR